MKKRIFLILFCCLLLLLAACGEKEPAKEDEVIEPPLQMSTLLTAAQVQEATGIAVVEPQQFTDGSVGYFSADQREVAYIAGMEMTAAAFEDMVTTMSAGFDVIDAPNLGEKAVWCESQLGLYAYADGWAWDIHVEYDPVDANDSLLAARQLAALLMEAI